MTEEKAEAVWKEVSKIPKIKDVYYRGTSIVADFEIRETISKTSHYVRNIYSKNGDLYNVNSFPKEESKNIISRSDENKNFRISIVENDQIKFIQLWKRNQSIFALQTVLQLPKTIGKIHDRVILSQGRYQKDYNCVYTAQVQL